MTSVQLAHLIPRYSRLACDNSSCIFQAVFCVAVGVAIGGEALRDFVSGSFWWLACVTAAVRDVALILRNWWTMNLATFRLVAIAAPFQAKKWLTVGVSKDNQIAPKIPRRGKKSRSCCCRCRSHWRALMKLRQLRR